MKSWQRIIRFVGFVAAISVWSTVVSAEPEFKVTAADGGSGDEFGRAVSIDGDFAVVGAWHIGTDIQNGAAYIYKRASGNTWTEIQKLTAPDGGRFGASVSMDGDNVIIGAYNADTGNGTDSGAAYVYVRDTVTDNFILQQTLVPADGTPGDFFGWSVAVDGAYAVIGAQNDDENGQVSGSAYIYKFNGTQWVKQIKLTPDDVGEFDYYGSSVSISGPYAIVGAIQHTGPFVNGPGAVYVYKRVGDTWSPHATLVADDPSNVSYFGKSVHINGDDIIVGAQHAVVADSNQAGAAYVFTRSPGDDTFIQQNKLTAEVIGAYDYFGWSVSINGDHAVVGAIDNPYGNWPGPSIGSAYYFARLGGTWQQTDQQKIASPGSDSDYFGVSVDVSQNDFIVGASKDGVSGAAYIYPLGAGVDPGPSIALSPAALDFGDVETGDTAADSVEVQNTGTAALTVSAVAVTGADVASFATPAWTPVSIDPGGSVFVHASFSPVSAGAKAASLQLTHNAEGGVTNIPLSGSGITPTPPVPVVVEFKLSAPDVGPGDFYGRVVAIDGNYAAVGAPYKDFSSHSGSVFIYKRSDINDTWIQTYQLNPADGHHFGWSLSLDGPYLIVGASYAGDAAFIFKRESETETWSQQVKLTAPEIGQGYFGTSVDIDDPYAIVGASHDDENGPYSGSAYIYVRDGETWSMQTKVYGKQDVEVYDYFGESVAISGDFAAVGAIGLKPGSLGNGYVHIFGRDGTNWNFAQELSGDAGFGQDYFGKSIAMEGDDLIVGGQHTTVDGYWRAGAAYIFTRSGGSESLSLQQKLMVSDADTSDVFGWAVSINGDLAVVGAPGRDDNGTDSGSSYVYVRTGTTWNQEFMITASDASENDNFGLAVATDGVNIIVGSVNQGFISGNAESSLAAGAVPTIGFRFGVNTKVQTTGTSGSAYVYRIPAGPTPGTDPAPVTISFRSVFGAPGDTILIPIHLSNSNTGRPVAGLQFASTLSHPEWVTYVGLADTSLLGDFVFASSLINDTLRVVAYSPTAGSISPGTDIHVVTIVGVIDGPTPLGSTNQIFAFETELADSNGVAFPDTLIIGAIQAGIRGDVSLDGRVAIGDVVKNVRLIIGLDQMPEPGSTLHNIADVNIDKQVDVADVIRQVNMILGIVTRPVPVASEPVTVSLGDVRIGPDGRQLVPVVLGGGSAMSGVQITFAYDPSLMTIGELVTTEAGVGWVWQHHARDGVYTLVGYGLQPAAGLTADSAPTFYLPVSITGRDAGRSLLTLTDVKLVDRTAHYLDVNLEGITVTVNREVALPAAFSLSEAAPNPFNPSTSIAYEVPEQTRITLTIYNLLGQEVVRLMDQVQAAGRYEVVWHGINSQGAGVASGVYLYRIVSGSGYTETKRMTLLK